MLAYTTGIVLFALAILISVSLHEFGHMLTAKAFGMKVTRYFVGFGPTLWSFRRGETEYGVKGIPLGGFVKITGMTPLEEEEEEVTEADKKRVFWRKPLWQRTVVLAAGSVTHFLLGFVALWILVSFVGVGVNPAYAEAAAEAEQRSAVTVAECVSATDADAPAGDCPEGQIEGPAHAAGIEDGDEVTAIDGTAISDWDSLVATVSALTPGEPVTVTVDRAGTESTVEVTPYAAVAETEDGGTETVARFGVYVYMDESIPYGAAGTGPVSGVGETVTYTGDMFRETFIALGKLPSKIPPLWDAIMGGERGEDTPVSVVGASRLGGEMVQYEQWAMFFMLLVVLNYFIGIFNLLPLLPMDGGHIAIAWYERLRSWIASRRGRPDPGRVDYLKLMPLTYAVIVLLGGFMLLTITADIVNPITIFN
ncbi:RIP metalloprotease [Glycomyces sp. NRRL B-16210]|uniref:M50 family metallopeptidase n=1 Tax=Glycomyces sp. NRRL B-16210 TaxID=1463821 RepID=UPI0004C14DE5|nr:site-2 protease family protein [Glycomyces sp. NRRL B-16210]